MNNECKNYIYNLKDIIIPYINTKKLCLSTDKTKLFIVSFIRTLIYFYILFEILDRKPVNNILMYGMLLMILLSIISLVVVILHKQLIPKN